MHDETKKKFFLLNIRLLMLNKRLWLYYSLLVYNDHFRNHDVINQISIAIYLAVTLFSIADSYYAI